MDDPYMQARACDVKDVTGRILNNLTGVVEGGIDSQVPVILAAADLAPSETIQLDKSKILGHRHPGRLREQPHRHPGPHYGHPRGLRPGGQL